MSQMNWKSCRRKKKVGSNFNFSHGSEAANSRVGVQTNVRFYHKDPISMHWQRTKLVKTIHKNSSKKGEKALVNNDCGGFIAPFMTPASAKWFQLAPSNEEKSAHVTSASCRRYATAHAALDARVALLAGKMGNTRFKRLRRSSSTRQKLFHS
jgi:hypothetical protein